MQISQLIEKYRAERATVEGNYKDWVYSKAREVDLNDPCERRLVRHLSRMMPEFMFRHWWDGVSSNNIFWDATDEPIRVIQIAAPKKEVNVGGQGYVTLVNPEVKECCGINFESHEGCGSIPGKRFCLSRKSYVHLVGYALTSRGFKHVDLEYGSKEQIPYRRRNLSIPQHELDHTDGVTLLQRGTVYYSFF